MNIKTIALITATVLGGGSLLATNNTYADTPITIPFEDVNMCNAVASKVGSDKIEENNCSDETNPNIIMTDSNIESITSLYLDSNNISNITGIEYFTSLTDLSLSDNQITDLTGIEYLTSLTSLELLGNQISDLAPLKNLISLEHLQIANNPIIDIAPILQLNLTGVPFLEGEAPLFALSDTANSKEYVLPSLFQFFNATLDVAPVAEWVTEGQEMMRQAKDAGMLKFEPQNATMNEDGKSITILDTNEPVIINVWSYNPENPEEKALLALLTITYEEPVDPDDPTDPTNDPAVPNTGENTQESSAAAFTATLCILSGIILTAIPMTRLYLRMRDR